MKQFILQENGLLCEFLCLCELNVAYVQASWFSESLTVSNIEFIVITIIALFIVTIQNEQQCS